MRQHAPLGRSLYHMLLASGAGSERVSGSSTLRAEALGVDIDHLITYPGGV
ncbi:hypothetical protein BHM03_00041269 [Ensete ventricosum]|nr:hypothetical protein BHM03_00041269 [Ensete ventricosum]